MLCQTRQARPPRIGQPQQFGRLIKGFTRRVIDRLPQDGIAPHPIDSHQLGVTTRHEQGNKRKFRRIDTEKG